eukprot:CAMPEP_0168550440 /NCGR_PEP_ID=MMETSP0413-20121227/5641_1 /TAXON_ID=136452 /ORGANISM="Filamoeba nolandi, Strain NC-AS-23-1" /LENGTH=138 /DNA_ID=CAMNT_0008580901 /DNA_START=23 /DNA_END=435 /DNA_ORIENTATION=+
MEATQSTTASISPSTSVSQTTNEPSPALLEASRVMFTNLSDYLQSELQVAAEDFKLLENMNNVTLEKYVEMTNTAQSLSTFMEDLQKKYAEFEPYIQKINQIDTNVAELESTVQLLDDYSKRLEEKFKKLVAQKKEAA